MGKCGTFILILYFATITSALRTKSFNNPLVDALIVKLNQATWDEDEATCRTTTLEMLYGVKNKTLWAVWAWDAMQPAVGALYAASAHLGNYDQCLKAPWSSGQAPVLQYCLVDVETDPSQPYRYLGPYDDVEDYLKITTKYGRPMNKQMFGVCLPSSCRPDTVGKVYRLMHQFSYLTEGNVTVNPRDCHVAGEAEPKTMGFIVFWAFIAALTLAVAISTCYHTLIEHKNKTLESITKPFCAKTNMAELVKQNDNEIKVMNGLRFLTTLIVVMIHEVVIRSAVPVMNILDMEQFEKSILGKIIHHSDVVVDTFFVMSGLLMTKAVLSGRNKNLLLWLVKRYIRLIGPYAIVTLFVLTAIHPTGDGPCWKRGMSYEVDTCELYWWKNILLINNDIQTVCVGVTWYVSCDYQLALLGAFIFYLYRKNKKVGLSVFFVTGVICTAKIAWVTYSKKLPLLPFESFSIFIDVRNHVLLNDVYFNIESRVSSYFIGMTMGYVLTVYKPSSFRNTINKMWSAIIMVLSLLLLAMIVSLKCIYDPPTYNPIEVATLVALNKSIWVFGICGIILVSEYGWQNIITDFLSSAVFSPLSKLSYGIYLVHFLIEQRNTFSLRNIPKHDMFLSATNSIGTAVISCFTSFIIYLLIEAPFVKISNNLFTEKKVQSNSNGTEASHINQNGHSKTKVS